MESWTNRLKSKLLGGMMILAGAGAILPAAAADPPSASPPRGPAGPRRTALFVNHSSRAPLDEKLAALESKVASLIGGKDFSIIPRPAVLKAIRDYPLDPTDPGNPEAPGSKLERLLSDSASALRLATNLGADFILFVSISSPGQEMKRDTNSAAGIGSSNIVHTLRGSYKLIEGVAGGVLAGDTFHVARTVRVSSRVPTASASVLEELTEDAAINISENFLHKTAQEKVAAAAHRVEISIRATARDPQARELSLPDLRLNEKNELVRGEKTFTPEVRATIEIDGNAVGTTPARLKVAPGRHRLRLTRAGFADTEMSIDGIEGLALRPVMQLNEAGLRRWNNIRDELGKLETNRKLTDAEIKVVEGCTRMLRQGGYQVNTAEGLKTGRSIY